MTALACALAVSTACRSEEVKVDRSPLPTVAAPPYLCDHIPLKAVELMTGVRNPLVRGSFDLTLAGGLGDGSCNVYQRDGDQWKVLHVGLTPGGYPGEIKEQLEDGASSLPEVVPGAIGFYFKDKNSKNNAAYAMLVRGKAEINIQLERGVAGRDNAADVLALMKLIAPKLLTDASAPPATTTSPSPSPTKE
ncbi:hypothetical protein ABZV14_06910 [Streptosporangium canum]|uniref:hypothetical protein n=1 Tax=Streptosporangium canum TaxID=324952 RepID=UPI0033AEEC98